MSNLILSYGDSKWTLEEVTLCAESTDNEAFWKGYISFLCFSPIEDNRAFFTAIEGMVKNLFDNRIVGVHPTLTGLDIRRRLTPDELILYGDGIKSIVVVRFRTIRNHKTEFTVEKLDRFAYSIDTREDS